MLLPPPDFHRVREVLLNFNEAGSLLRVCSGTVQFSCSVVSDSLRCHGLLHTRLPCPSPAPGAYSNSGPSSWWWHPTILSSVIPFSYLQSFPASGSFPISQFFTSGGQSTGVSASVLPMNIQDWFQWYHPAISSSVIPFASCLQSFPASGSFPMNQLSASGDQILELQFEDQSFLESSGLISFRIDWFDLLEV